MAGSQGEKTRSRALACCWESIMAGSQGEKTRSRALACCWENIMAGSQGEVTIGKEIEKETTTTMTTTTQGLVSGAAIPSPPVNLRLWLVETITLQMGLVPVFSSHSQPESGLEEELLMLPVDDDACSPTFRHRDGHKRKEFSTGVSEEDFGAFDHKRHRQVHLQSSASSSYGSVAMSIDVYEFVQLAEMYYAGSHGEGDSVFQHRWKGSTIRSTGCQVVLGLCSLCYGALAGAEQHILGDQSRNEISIRCSVCEGPWHGTYHLSWHELPTFSSTSDTMIFLQEKQQ